MSGEHKPTWANCLEDDEMTKLRFDSGENVKVTVQTHIKRYSKSYNRKIHHHDEESHFADSTQFYVRGNDGTIHEIPMV